MIPQGILKQIGISLASIAESASQAIPLRELLAAVRSVVPSKGVFFTFINTLVNAGQGITRSEAAAQYKQAVYWTNVGSYLSQYPPDEPLDPALARKVVGGNTYANEYGGFLTNVTATVRDPATGETKDYHFWVSTPYAPSLSDLAFEVSPRIDEVLGVSPGPGGATESGGLHVTYSITDFAEYRQ